MKNKKKLSTGQILWLIATGMFGLLAMLFGIACIKFDHLMEGAAIVQFDIVLVALLVVMIRDNKPKVNVPDLGTNVFTMRGIDASLDGTFRGAADVTLMTDGVFIDVIGDSPIGYRFDEISMFSSDKTDEFAFAVGMEHSITLSKVKRLHAKALAEAFNKHGIRGVCANVN